MNIAKPKKCRLKVISCDTTKRDEGSINYQGDVKEAFYKKKIWHTTID